MTNPTENACDFKESDGRRKSLLEQVQEKGKVIACPNCQNETFYIQGGFLDENDNLYDAPFDGMKNSVMFVICTKCKLNCIQEKAT